MANLFDAPWVVKFCPFSQKNDFLGGGTITEEVVEEREGHKTPEQRDCVAGGALEDREDEKKKSKIIARYCEWDDDS